MKAKTTPTELINGRTSEAIAIMQLGISSDKSLMRQQVELYNAAERVLRDADTDTAEGCTSALRALEVLKAYVLAYGNELQADLYEDRMQAISSRRNLIIRVEQREGLHAQPTAAPGLRHLTYDGSTSLCGFKLPRYAAAHDAPQCTSCKLTGEAHTFERYGIELPTELSAELRKLAH